MSKNIILKTINEVKYFHTRILFAITLKEQVTFLILSNDIIFDIDNLKNYLIENELNHFAKNEIINLINLIDSFLQFKIRHNEIPKSENQFSYEYPTKGRGFGDGNLMYIIRVNDKFLKSNENEFNIKEPSYSKLTNHRYFTISNKLLEIKNLFATYLEDIQQHQQPKTTIINDMSLDEFLNKYKQESLKVDLANEYPLVYDKLKRQKLKLNSVTFETEIDEVITFCENGIKELKNALNTAIISGHSIENYTNRNPPFLMQIKLYYEYLQLYKVANNNKQPKQPEATDLNTTSKTKKPKDYKKHLWFTTGIPLATGEAFELHRKYKGVKGCFERICEDLKIVKGRPYISTTLNDTKPKEVFNKNGIKLPMRINDKNTFADKDKLQKLHKELTEKNLPFGAEFLEKYNQIETE